MAGEEVQVGAEGLLDQAKMAAGSVVEGHGLDGPREVHRQVEDIPRLGLGLQKGQATQKGAQVVPAGGLDQFSRQVAQGVGRHLLRPTSVFRPAPVGQSLVAPPRADEEPASRARVLCLC